MPMLAGYEAIRATVADAIGDAGLRMTRLEEVLPDPEWQWWLLAAMPSAVCGLVDITDHNPFVMYELGLAHSRRLPTLLIVDARNERVSATVLGTPFLPYDRARLDSYRPTLTAWLRILADSSAAGSPNAAEGQLLDSAQSYSIASRLLGRFKEHVGEPIDAVSRAEFDTRLLVAEGRGECSPRSLNQRVLAFHLLPRIIRAADEVRIMSAVVDWVASLEPFERQPSPI